VSSLREAWEEHAAAWVVLAGEPHLDSCWRFHRDAPRAGRPEAAIVDERSRRWQRVPLFLHVRAVKPR
jgi:hypothetical protein